MSEPIETIEYKGSTIEIYYDEDPHENPNDWDPENECLIYDHRDFTVFPSFGKIKLDSDDNQAIFDDFIIGMNTKVICEREFHLFPIYAFIHGGVSLHMTREGANQYEPTGFDTSFKGFCLIGVKAYPEREKAHEIAESHIKTWNMLLSGEIYGYNINGEGGCWGYYGDDGKKHMIEEAKAEIDSKDIEIKTTYAPDEDKVYHSYDGSVIRIGKHDIDFLDKLRNTSALHRIELMCLTEDEMIHSLRTIKEIQAKTILSHFSKKWLWRETGEPAEINEDCISLLKDPKFLKLLKKNYYKYSISQLEAAIQFFEKDNSEVYEKPVKKLI